MLASFHRSRLVVWSHQVLAATSRWVNLVVKVLDAQDAVGVGICHQHGLRRAACDDRLELAVAYNEIGRAWWADNEQLAFTSGGGDVLRLSSRLFLQTVISQSTDGWIQVH
ncbi:hypothetical protein [Arthrobacter sp. Hiyo1]|uniref:hypothetical protein n=1 Tax=Arthrobacter sp. Hiyo1 TaxID=1588020 RepID=UPI001C0EEFF4|nr:hypothetical protein [Arthrobacter sp. Hiyo1]